MEKSIIVLGFMFFLVSCDKDDNAMESWEPEAGRLKTAVEPLFMFGWSWRIPKGYLHL